MVIFHSYVKLPEGIFAVCWIKFNLNNSSVSWQLNHFTDIPSGKQPHNYGKSPSLISMAMLVYQRVTITAITMHNSGILWYTPASMLHEKDALSKITALCASSSASRSARGAALGISCSVGGASIAEKNNGLVQGKTIEKPWKNLEETMVLRVEHRVKRFYFFKVFILFFFSLVMFSTAQFHISV